MPPAGDRDRLQLLAQIAAARAFLRAAGLRKGDRCALIAPNSIRWAALDLAIIGEGFDRRPALRAAGARGTGRDDARCRSRLDLLRRRRAARRDCGRVAGCAATSCCSTKFSRGGAAAQRSRLARRSAPQDTVAILYTSGTSGEAKGVMLTVGNLDHMLSCTAARLDQLMGRARQPDRVFIICRLFRGIVDSAAVVPVAQRACFTCRWTSASLPRKSASRRPIIS